MAYVCKTCGAAHDGLPTDYAFELPDDVWAIPEPERRRQARFTSDLCQWGDRYFLRGVLDVPLLAQGGHLGWGVWAEVGRPVFERYVALYDADGSAEIPHAGRLANALPGYDDTIGLQLQIRFQDQTKRPRLYAAPESGSRLAKDQHHGIDEARYHEIVARLAV